MLLNGFRLETLGFFIRDQTVDFSFLLLLFGLFFGFSCLVVLRAC